jgi:opacity protein-like surface antigen
VKNTILSLITVAGLSAVSPAAQAQSYNPFQIGASGGIAFPTSDLGNTTNTGYNIAVSVGVKPLMMPIGIRGEAAWNQFGFKNGPNGSINIPSFTGNLTYGLPLGVGFSPYIIGGIGLYRPSADINGTSSQATNEFGWNAGGGLKLPLSTSFETFVEARYNSVNVNGGTLSFVPLTVGFMF